MKLTTLTTLLAALALTARAELKLPAIIGDNMVLQQGQPVPIWGWAEKHEQIIVQVAGQSHSTTAGNDEFSLAFT